LGVQPGFVAGRRAFDGQFEAAAKLKWRLFPESYAIHWAEEKAH
jgi:hypothetical protein